MPQVVADRVPCNVCGEAVQRALVVKGGHCVLQCSHCGLAFTHPHPESVEAQYDSAYFDIYRKRREFRLRRADARLRRIERLTRPGRLLDVGCSIGYFVEAAVRRGWEAAGVEISPFAAQEAREVGLSVRTGALESAAFPDESFDCVTMWDVLEHVPDPTKHMREVARILAKGGLVVVGTPDLGHLMFRCKRDGWRHLKPAEHIYYFCRASIKRLFKKTGFDVVCCPGSSGWLSFTQFNDVMTIYGVKNGLKVPVG